MAIPSSLHPALLQPRFREETLVTGVQAASGSSALSDDWLVTALVAQLEVTAVAGTTPTLNVAVQHSIDGVNWTDLITFTQATGAVVQMPAAATLVNRRLRVNWTIGGTGGPSFTFNVKVAGR